MNVGENGMLNTDGEMIEEQMDDGQQHQMQQIYVQKQQARKRKVAKTMMVNNQVSKYAAARGKKGLTSQQMRMGNTAESMGQENPL